MDADISDLIGNLEDYNIKDLIDLKHALSKYIIEKTSYAIPWIDTIRKEAIKDFIKKPRCLRCGKPWIHDIDSKTKKKSNYLWKPSCSCIKNLRVSIG